MQHPDERPPRPIPADRGFVCSKCGLAVRQDAIVCKHCGVQFVGLTGQPLKAKRGVSLKAIGLMFVGVCLVVCAALVNVGGNQAAPVPTAAPAVVVAPTEQPTELATAIPTEVPTAVPATIAPTDVPPTAGLPTEPAPTQEPTAVSTSTPAHERGYISREMVSEEWPLTVDEGVFRCDGLAVMFVADGTIYALNGIASGRADTEGWADIRAIWRDRTDIDGLKVNISPVLDAGLKFCQG